MINKRNLPILLLVLGGGVFVAFRTLGLGGTPPTKYERILLNVGTMLEQIHYSPKAIDDKFSKEVFDKYMGEVDAEKACVATPAGADDAGGFSAACFGPLADLFVVGGGFR